MNKKVTVIHTSFVSVQDLKNLFSELVPSATMYNIVDDSLLQEVLANRGLTTGVTRRICAYSLQAESMGVDLIFNQCSSVGEAVDIARKMLHTPYIKVDEPMAEEAVKAGKNISVIATVETTLGPSARLIERTAAENKKKVNIKQCLVQGAFEVLTKEKDTGKHNSMIMDVIMSEEKTSDVIVLAQGSMMCLVPHLPSLRIPVLTSSRSGVARAAKILGDL